MQQVSVDEAQIQLPHLVDAALNGECVSIVTADQKVVQLVPMPLPRRRRQAGSARGLVKMNEDFDAPLEDFKEYME
jgi:antitoxin (DNA-binding transcriptional repressor) of toxin-antitoxin stability system